MSDTITHHVRSTIHAQTLVDAWERHSGKTHCVIEYGPTHTALHFPAADYDQLEREELAGFIAGWVAYRDQVKYTKPFESQI